VLTTLGERADVIDVLHHALQEPRGECVSAADLRSALSAASSLVKPFPTSLPSSDCISSTWTTGNYSYVPGDSNAAFSAELLVRPQQPSQM
jgi:hypothetical protein